VGDGGYHLVNKDGHLVELTTSSQRLLLLAP
jgi:hypothetical protein